MDLSRVFEAIISYNDPSTKGIDMTEEDQTPKRVDSLEDEDNKESFAKNDLIYFMGFRFIGGGGTPYAIQNILPILFDMSLKKYLIATFIGSMPSMFVTVSLGSGIESVIDQNVSPTISSVLLSPEIYIPLIAFFIILIIFFIIKKFYFKQ